MKALTALNKYFNTDVNGKRIKSVKEFKAEVDQLSIAEKNQMGALAAKELGEPFEPQQELP